MSNFKYGEYKMPLNINRECIRIMRDRKRLENILKESDGEYDMEESQAYERLDAIHRALLEIPYEYRKAVVESTFKRQKNIEMYIHENTLKKYKSKFLYHLAKNLSLY